LARLFGAHFAVGGLWRERIWLVREEKRKRDLGIVLREENGNDLMVAKQRDDDLWVRLHHWPHARLACSLGELHVHQNEIENENCNSAATDSLWARTQKSESQTRAERTGIVSKQAKQRVHLDHHRQWLMVEEQHSQTRKSSAGC